MVRKRRLIDMICMEITSDDEEHGDVRLCGALVEVDRPDDDHGQRDHDRHRARDGAADGAQEEDEDLQRRSIHGTTN